MTLPSRFRAANEKGRLEIEFSRRILRLPVDPLIKCQYPSPKSLTLDTGVTKIASVSQAVS
jgi:hypothetical protein